MSGDQREYRAEERHLYEPPPCSNCGSTNVRVSWIDVSSAANAPGDEIYIPGTHQCRDCRGLQQ